MLPNVAAFLCVCSSLLALTDAAPLEERAAQPKQAAPFPRLSPEIKNPFSVPLPIPKTKQPSTSWKNPKTGVEMDFYEITAKEFPHKFFPGLADSTLWGYDGQFPGPTIRVKKGRESVVRLVNSAPSEMNLHLHGSYSRSPWDGYAVDLIKPNEYKDYYYPNNKQRTLWYHDHTNEKNAINAYKGLMGVYIVEDPELDKALNIPSGNDKDVPLILGAAYFTKNGVLSNEENQVTSIYGDTYMVNGQIKPFLSVDPTLYRFRVLNAAISRSFNLTLETAEGEKVPMKAIGSDGGFRETPVDTQSLVTSMAERWEILVDFARFAGKTLTLKTANLWTDTEYEGIGELMQFKVSDRPADFVSPLSPAQWTSKLPADVKFPSNGKIGVQHLFRFESHMDMVWAINGNDDTGGPFSNMLMKPPLGTLGKLTFIANGFGMMMPRPVHSADPAVSGGDADAKGAMSSSIMGGMMNGDMKDMMKDMMQGGHGGMMNGGGHGGMMGGGKMRRALGKFIDGLHDGIIGAPRRSIEKRKNAGKMREGHKQLMDQNTMAENHEDVWVHPIHLHLADMQIVTRRKDINTSPDGRAYIEPYEQGAVKDVVTLGNNEEVEVLANFAPYPGVYMFHCHNTIHEDMGMMSQFNVTKMQDMGYSELDTALEDPMDGRFKAKAFTGTDLKQVQNEVLPGFAALNAYPSLEAIKKVEAEYWASHDITPVVTN